MTEKKKSDVYGIDLMILKDEPSRQESGAGDVIRVVQWVFPRGSSVKLEKRSYYTKDGKKLTGKASGLALADMRVVIPNLPKIMLLMENPPAVERKPAKAAEEPIKEVPF